MEATDSWTRNRLVGRSSSWFPGAFLFAEGFTNMFDARALIGSDTFSKVPELDGTIWIKGSPVIWQRHWFGKEIKIDVSVKRWSMASTPTLARWCAVSNKEFNKWTRQTSPEESPIRVPSERLRWCSQNNLWYPYASFLSSRRLHFWMTALKSSQSNLKVICNH